MNARETILNSCPLGEPTDPWPAPYFVLPPGSVVEAFKTSLNLLGARTIDENELAGYIGPKTWVEPNAGLEVNALNGFQNQVDLWDAEVGIASTVLAIAQTGSVCVKSGQGNSRLATLAPPINILIVHRNKIVPSLLEALELLPDGNVAFITGASRTADIEGVLVPGIHGPKEVLVCLVGGEH